MNRYPKAEALEEALFAFGSALLSLGLAIRLTNVTGEILIERRL